MTPEYFAALAALVVYTSSHIAEIVRGSIQAVPRGRARRPTRSPCRGSSGMWFVVLPQAMRIAVPPIGNQYLNLAKNSSLAAVISFPELTKVTQLSVGQPLAGGAVVRPAAADLPRPVSLRHLARRQPRSTAAWRSWSADGDAIAVATDRRLLAMPEPAPPPSRGARDWLRQNLFRSWRRRRPDGRRRRGGRGTCSTALGRFVFVTGRWDIVRANLTLFMVGRYPRDELWRVCLSLCCLAAYGGVLAGFVHRRQLAAGRAGPELHAAGTRRRHRRAAVAVAARHARAAVAQRRRSGPGCWRSGWSPRGRRARRRRASRAAVAVAGGGRRHRRSDPAHRRC